MSDRLVNLTSFGTVEEAHLAKNALEAEGLHAFLDGEASVGNLWHLGNAMGGVKLLVPEDEIPRAQEILDRDEEEDEPDLHVTEQRPEGPLEPETRITDVRPEPAFDLDDSDADLRRDEEESDEPNFAPGAVMATRAFRCAILSFFVPFLIIYSLWVLVTLYRYDGELDENSQRKLFWAVLLNGVVVLGIVLLFGFMR